MRRLALALSITAALVLAAALAVPAFGGPSIPQLAAKVSKALKLAKSADKRSKKALALAKRAAGQIGAPGTNGTNGTNGSTGGSGTPGPAGPPGPSGATKIGFRADAGTPDTTIFDAEGLKITARCDAGPNLVVNASSSVDNSEIHVEGVKGPNGTATPVYSENDHFGPGSPAFGLPTANFQGTLTYSTPAGALVTATIAAEQTAFNGTKACWFAGWALRDPS